MSTQVNVRLNEHLLSEIDTITRVLHISRTEWLRMKIARAAKEDTLNLMEAIVLEYAKGHITENELEKILGSDAEEITFIVRKMKEGKKSIDDLIGQGKL